MIGSDRLGRAELDDPNAGGCREGMELMSVQIEHERVDIERMRQDTERLRADVRRMEKEIADRDRQQRDRDRRFTLEVTKLVVGTLVVIGAVTYGFNWLIKNVPALHP